MIKATDHWWRPDLSNGDMSDPMKLSLNKAFQSHVAVTVVLILLLLSETTRGAITDQTKLFPEQEKGIFMSF